MCGWGSGKSGVVGEGRCIGMGGGGGGRRETYATT